jgi:hypothetical protein
VAESASAGLGDHKLAAGEFSVMRHSSSAPSGLKMAVSPSIVAMPLPSPSFALGPCGVLYS